MRWCFYQSLSETINYLLALIVAFVQPPGQDDPLCAKDSPISSLFRYRTENNSTFFFFFFTTHNKTLHGLIAWSDIVCHLWCIPQISILAKGCCNENKCA